MPTVPSQIKAWHDSTSYKEIVALVKDSTARIVVVVREVRQAVAIMQHLWDCVTDSRLYYKPRGLLRFASGAEVSFATTRNVLDMHLRSKCFTAAYLVDSFYWQRIEYDTVLCELMPTIGR